ncbi:MAG: glycosyl transferase, partial [Gammaproteobacteria bacterium]|nr:glycosyl transferase [Gammaproteobacteria bacterium]
ITNFPPARIFMGDAGSIPLGLMVSAFSIWGILNEIFPVWLPLLTFSPFIVDATVTILRRLIQGEKIWHAHRSHYYQRMVLAGWGHKRTAYAEYLLMIACGSTSLVALQLGGHVWWIMAGIWTMIYLIILFLIEKKVSVNA